MQRGDLAAAERQLRRHLREAPLGISGLLPLAEVLERRGDLEGAAEIYRRLAEKSALPQALRDRVGERLRRLERELQNRSS
jgi:Tfp pilus assembly protein PilF